jgi:hypothetical protein
MQRLVKVDEGGDNRLKQAGVLVKEQCNIPNAKL